MVAFESGASRPPGAMSRPPRRLRRSCTHDGADLQRDALGQFICDICGQPCEDEPPDAGAEP
jgi:rubrerythrin